MFETIIPIVIASTIVGTGGYVLRALIAQNQFLAKKAKIKETAAYSMVQHEWYVYHLTSDLENNDKPILAKGTIQLLLKKNAIVEGVEKTEMPHHPILHYNLRGEVRAGKLFLTGICREDPSDGYMNMFPNLLGNELLGISMGLDYARIPYSSPVIMTRDALTDENAYMRLKSAKVKWNGKCPDKSVDAKSIAEGM